MLVTLRYLYPSKFDTMITGEAPDLQDSASSTGIEVTAAVKEDDMKVSRAFSDSGTADGEKRFFQESIQRKTKKIQQYRSNFKRMGLAILLPEIPTSYAENHLSEWITELFDESANLFDFVHVISHRFCLYYDTQAKITEKRSLTQDESLLLATIGRMTAKGELTMTDTEWQ